MSSYTPKGKALKAMLHLDGEGPQYGTELSAHIDILRTDLKRTLETALKHDLVGSEYRIRRGSKCHMLWYLTPDGARMLEQIRAADGVVA